MDRLKEGIACKRTRPDPMPILKRKQGPTQHWDTIVWYEGSRSEILRGSTSGGVSTTPSIDDDLDADEALELEAHYARVRAIPELCASVPRLPSGLALFPPVHAAVDRSNPWIERSDPHPVRALRSDRTRPPSAFRPSWIPGTWSRGVRTIPFVRP